MHEGTHTQITPVPPSHRVPLLLVCVLAPSHLGGQEGRKPGRAPPSQPGKEEGEVLLPTRFRQHNRIPPACLVRLCASHLGQGKRACDGTGVTGLPRSWGWVSAPPATQTETEAQCGVFVAAVGRRSAGCRFHPSNPNPLRTVFGLQKSLLFIGEGQVGRKNRRDCQELMK